MKRPIQGIVIVGVLLAILSQAWATEDSLRLDNQRIAVEIDRESGALRSIRDKQQNVVYPQSRHVF